MTWSTRTRRSVKGRYRPFGAWRLPVSAGRQKAHNTTASGREVRQTDVATDNMSHIRPINLIGLVAPAQRASRACIAGALAVAICALVVVSGSGPAAAFPYATVTLTGHGWGHGHGMGQWGALGYALGGSTYQQILSTYYGTLSAGGSTALGNLPDGWSDAATPVTVALTENGAQDVIVSSKSAFTVDGQSLPAGWGALFHLESPGSSDEWEVYTSSGGCGGNGNWGSPIATTTTPEATPGSEPFPSDGNLANEVLQLCELPTNISVRGSIEGTVNSSDDARTVNVLPLGQYVADVTPSESPVSWGSLGSTGAQGEPEGFQELEAQAVAVRAYVMSSYGGLQGYFGYADICDSTACQYYPGIANENALADTAVTDTANQVVLLPGGTVATTQYSSSTGGYTAGGTFAAVPDLGDSICTAQACNSHHTWQATVPVSAMAAAYPQIGTLSSVEVTERNGLGDYGGRVQEMTLIGTAGSVTLTGDQFAAQFSGDNVQSDWFEVTNEASGGVAGYWLLGNDGGIFSFGDANFHGSMGGTHLNEPMVGMAATNDDGGYWTVASDGGIFSFGDANFHGSMGGAHLNEPMVGMAATNDDGGYWTLASDGGIFSFGDANFHGSMGGAHLNEPMVGMAATNDDGGYWTVASDGGIFSFGDAAYHGSLGDIHLTEPIVAMAATPNDGGYWLVAADGGVFALGDAPYEGSLPGDGVRGTAVAIIPSADGLGYLIVTAGGRAVPFGDAPQFGDPDSVVSNFSGHLVDGVATS